MPVLDARPFVTPGPLRSLRSITGPPLTLACWLNPDVMTGFVVVYLGNVNLSFDGFWLGLGADGHIEATTVSGNLAVYDQAESTSSAVIGDGSMGVLSLNPQPVALHTLMAGMRAQLQLRSHLRPQYRHFDWRWLWCIRHWLLQWAPCRSGRMGCSTYGC